MSRVRQRSIDANAVAPVQVEVMPLVDGGSVASACPIKRGFGQIVPAAVDEGQTGRLIKVVHLPFDLRLVEQVEIVPEYKQQSKHQQQQEATLSTEKYFHTASRDDVVVLFVFNLFCC